jgi:hypothetical protein
MEEVEPVLEVGRRIRKRKLEWSKQADQQNAIVIEGGDLSSHYGSVVADALVFHDTPENMLLFQSMYTVLPNIIIKHRKSAKLMKMFDWYGSLAMFKDSLDDVAKFKEHFNGFVKLVLIGTIDMDEYINTKPHAEAIFKDMEALYEGMYKSYRSKKSWGRRGPFGSLGRCTESKSPIS